MKVLMVGVDKTSLGGMLTVVENYINNPEFCKKTSLKYIPITTHGNKIKKVLFSSKAILKLFFSIKKEKFDLVHVHMSDKGSAYREGIVLWISKKMGCRTVAHMHAAEYEEWYRGLGNIRKAIVSKLLINADVILALGERWKNIYYEVTNGKGNVKVLYNAVTLPEMNLYNADSNNLIFLAHMIKRKGIDDLLDAIVLIKDKLPDKIRINLYGADREGNINERIHSRKLDDIVEYCGWLSGKEKENCLLNAKINILPSYNEGLPMTILETMAYGIPNIATNIAAIPEAIENGRNGLLIKPGDVNMLAEQIIDLINNPSYCKKISDAAYATIKNKFCLEMHYKKLISIYEELVLYE